MLDAAVFAAVAVVLGGVVAVSARDGRIVVLGLMLASVAAALVASPLPNSLAVTARILGAMLAAYLLWAAAGSGTVESAGSAFGPVAEGAVAVAAFAIGLSVSPVAPLGGPVEAQAAGLSLLALAVVPLAGRDVFRMGVGVTLLTLGGSLLVGAWAGQPMPLGQLAMAALLVGIAGATSLLIPTADAVEAAEAIAAAARHDLAADMREAATPPYESPLAAAAGPAAAEAGRATRQPPLDVIVKPATPAVETRPFSLEPEPRPRPMTADPIEPDDWLAWGAPQVEPTRPAPHQLRPGTGSRSADVTKSAPKKPTIRTRPDLRGKP